jgi:sugar phosphate isomerase/epimerase
LATLALGASALAAPPASTPTEPFGYCLNTSTIRGQKLTLPQTVDVAAQAGYHAIEPWIGELDQFVQAGGTLKDLAKQLRDHGLVVPDAIGFPEWIVDDDAKRRKGLDEAKRCFDLVQQLGCSRLAAPPVGATQQPGLDLLKAADRYRALVELGATHGVTPLVELWGFSKNLSRLGEVLLVAIESGLPQAAILPDVYHLRKGGSDFGGLPLLRASTIGIFHVNDYPDQPDRAKLTDADRVYPGDGVAPLKDIFRTLHTAGYRGMLSIELFNRTYWQQDAALVARTGLAKLRAVVQASLGEK